MNDIDKFLNRIFPKKMPKRLRWVITILILSFLIVLIWVNRINFIPSNVGIWIVNKVKSIRIGTEFPYNTKDNKILPENFKLTGDNLLLLGSSSFISANLSMKEIHKSEHNFARPSMKTTSLRAITFDLGGKDFKIQSVVGEIFTGKTEKEIIACDVSENGTYVIVTRSQIYLAELTVFDRNNNEKYKYFFADCSVSDVTLSNDGKTVAVCGISAESFSGASNVYILDFKSEIPKSIIEIPENFVYSINFFENGNIEIVGDKFASVINPKNCSRQDFYFESMELKFFDFNKKEGIAFCLSSSGEKSGDIIVVIDANGTKRFFESFNESFVSISLYLAKIAVLGQNFVESYNFLTSEKTVKEVENGFKKLILTSSSRICLLGSESINEVKLS